jgi:hypothetical protein
VASEGKALAQQDPKVLEDQITIGKSRTTPTRNPARPAQAAEGAQLTRRRSGHRTLKKTN